MRFSVGICALVLGCGAATDADLGPELPTTDETERLRAELEEAREEMERLRAEAEAAKAQETPAVEPQESTPPPTREPEAQSKPEMAPPLAPPEPAAQPEDAPAPEPQGEQPEPPPEVEVEIEVAPPLSTPLQPAPPEPEPLPPPSVCGDGVISGAEVCDDGTFRAPWPGGCNQLCTAVYQEKRIREVIADGPAFGGVAGADSICQAEWGENWKALVVGEGRVASATPFLGDGQLDWVLQSWTIYVDDSWRPQVPDILNPGKTYSSVVWVTNSIALLGVRDGTEREYHPPEIDNSRIQGELHWAGYRADYTTGQTCGDWTVDDGRISDLGTVPFWSRWREVWDDFDIGCLAGPSYLRCIEQ